MWLDDSLEGRVERILQDYVIDLCAEFVAEHGADEGPAVFASALRQNLANITKRLGGERYRELDTIMQEALASQLASGDVDRHRDWIRKLLNDYYDPMYDYQLEQKAGRIIFRGNQREVVEYLRTQSAQV